jgi:hypothetical protein
LENLENNTLPEWQNPVKKAVQQVIFLCHCEEPNYSVSLRGADESRRRGNLVKQGEYWRSLASQDCRVASLLAMTALCCTRLLRHSLRSFLAMTTLLIAMTPKPEKIALAIRRIKMIQ